MLLEAEAELPLVINLGRACMTLASDLPLCSTEG